MGIRPQNCNITHAETVDDDDIYEDENRPDRILNGLVSFRLEVPYYGCKASIKVHLSEPAPENAIWVFYDPVGGWQDFSNYGPAQRVFRLEQIEHGAIGLVPDRVHAELVVVLRRQCRSAPQT